MDCLWANKGAVTALEHLTKKKYVPILLKKFLVNEANSDIKFKDCANVRSTM